MQINMRKITAVTLVELLVVLSIMGIVAALTVPGLKNHSQRIEYAKLAQKAYVQLEQAIDSAVVKTGLEPSEWSNLGTASYVLRDYLKEHFVNARDCSAEWNSSNACFKGYRNFKSTEAKNPSVRAIMLADGIVIAGMGSQNDKRSHFIIDVNGPAEPNMEGVDVFLFNFGTYDSECNYSVNGSMKLCPVSHAENLVDDNWTITYW